MTLALGLMSGTSADGISAVIADFKDRSFKIIGSHHHHYPDIVLQKVRRSLSLTVAELSALNMELGEEFAAAALRVLKKARVSPSRVSCIGSHGQTIYHGPADTVRNTLQLGDPAVIAERTGITVVSHFRERDIAAGGEGAPLIPFFDHYFFGSGPVRAFQNIGGIGNVTVVGRDVKAPLAFDTGPGNCLMDLAMRMVTHGSQGLDRNGRWAKQGKIDTECAERMMQHPYFKKHPPKSTGLELFNEAFLVTHVGRLLAEKPQDALATLNHFTGLSIQESYRSFVMNRYPLKEIIVSGGGTYNQTLMRKLKDLFSPLPVKTIEEFGIPSQVKEPLAFAFFGLRCLQGKPNHLPSGTGARGVRVLGSITKA